MIKLFTLLLFLDQSSYATVKMDDIRKKFYTFEKSQLVCNVEYADPKKKVYKAEMFPSEVKQDIKNYKGAENFIKKYQKIRITFENQSYTYNSNITKSVLNKKEAFNKKPKLKEWILFHAEKRKTLIEIAVKALNNLFFNLFFEFDKSEVAVSSGDYYVFKNAKSRNTLRFKKNLSKAYFNGPEVLAEVGARFRKLKNNKLLMATTFVGKDVWSYSFKVKDKILVPHKVKIVVNQVHVVNLIFSQCKSK
jgi:hypothetical protein